MRERARKKRMTGMRVGSERKPRCWVSVSLICASIRPFEEGAQEADILLWDSPHASSFIQMSKSQYHTKCRENHLPAPTAYDHSKPAQKERLPT